jgi:hypothetical protein
MISVVFDHVCSCLVAAGLFGVSMLGLNWKSVTAAHVTQACEALLKSAGSRAKPRGLIVTYKDKQLPAKVILRMAYRLANKLPSETKLKFSSGEGSLQLSWPSSRPRRSQRAA